MRSALHMRPILSRLEASDGEAAPFHYLDCPDFILAVFPLPMRLVACVDALRCDPIEVRAYVIADFVPQITRN
jgi:hypothetical protein